MQRLALLALILVAVVAGLALTQYLMPVRVVPGLSSEIIRTTGVLKELRDPSWFSSSKLRQATVVLADGSSVDASVIPGCEVGPGESVRVDVVGGNIPGDKAYIVVGAI